MIDNVVQPVELLIKEAESQRNRALEEVMQKLYGLIQGREKRDVSFTLQDGAQCFVVQFYEPRISHEGVWAYGFDVQFSEKHPLSHLEFKVTCSGYERGLA